MASSRWRVVIVVLTLCHLITTFNFRFTLAARLRRNLCSIFGLWNDMLCLDCECMYTLCCAYSIIVLCIHAAHVKHIMVASRTTAACWMHTRVCFLCGGGRYVRVCFYLYCLVHYFHWLAKHAAFTFSWLAVPPMRKPSSFVELCGPNQYIAPWYKCMNCDSRMTDKLKCEIIFRSLERRWPNDVCSTENLWMTNMNTVICFASQNVCYILWKPCIETGWLFFLLKVHIASELKYLQQLFDDHGVWVAWDIWTSVFETISLLPCAHIGFLSIRES